MPPFDEKSALQFLLHLSRATTTIRMYSPNHPAVQKGAEEAYEIVKQVLETDREVNIGRKEGQVLFQNRPVRENLDAADRFLDLLASHDIETLTIRVGLTADELTEFVKQIGVKSDLSSSEIQKNVNKLPHINANAITYKAVSTAEGEVLDRFDDQTIKTLASIDQEHLQRAFEKLADDLNTAVGGEEALRDKFNQSSEELATQMGLGVNEIGDHIGRLITSLSPDVQQNVFGETFSSVEEIDQGTLLQRLEMTFKAGLMTNELQRGELTDEEWEGRLERLLTSGEDVVRLAESIANKITENGEKLATDDESLSRLLRLLQTQAKPESMGDAKRVLIADADQGMIDQYQQVLKRSGVDLILCKSGTEAINQIREQKPDCVVLDIKLPGMTGLEVIQQLDSERLHIPVIVYTDSPAWQNEFAIQMYPKLKYLLKPFNVNDFMTGIEEYVFRGRSAQESERRKATSTAEEQDQEDLEKAHEIQAGLLPKEIPAIEGFELGSFYNACKDVGGDYFDIYQLDDDHMGFIIADVAGKGISAAMVMCMARTVFHSLVTQTLSPREVMLEANAMIHRDLVHGMFLTCLYLVLDTRTGEGRFCCAGHNPALVFTKDFGFSSFTKPSGIALGLVDNELFEKALEESTLQLRPGDQVIMYTDGVVECINTQRDEFGEQRLTKLVNSNQECSTAELLKRIIDAIAEHQGEAPQHDDITLVAVRNLDVAPS